MIDIPIYSEENLIRDKIKGSHIIAYNGVIEKSDIPKTLSRMQPPNFIAKAAKTDRDLYFHQSILVSTTCNKNDDTFLPEEVWKARHTPCDKPTNLDHNERNIVGHIVGNWAIDADYNVIDDNTTIDKLPSKFHILTSSVIYKAWEDREFSKTVDELLDKIEKGDIYTSMEALFTDFDYAVFDSDENLKIVARNEETAFLTKHLRIYGGSGEYNSYKIARIPRNITFSGKGYVDNPANPESIVFSPNDLFDFAKAKKMESLDDFQKSGVSLIKTEKLQSNKVDEMSDIYKSQAEKLEKDNKSLADEVNELKKQLADINVQKFEDTIKSLNEKIVASESDVKAKQDELDKIVEASKTLEEKVHELTEKNKALDAELDKVKQEQVFANRVSMLTAKNIDKAEAEKKVKIFESLSDEQFAEIAKEFKSTDSNKTEGDVKVIKVEAETDDDADDDKKAEAAESDLDDAKVDEDADMTIASDSASDEDAEIEALAKALCFKMSAAKLNDGKDSK